MMSWQPVKINKPGHPADQTGGYVEDGRAVPRPEPTDADPARTVDTWPVRLDITGASEHFSAAELIAL